MTDTRRGEVPRTGLLIGLYLAAALGGYWGGTRVPATSGSGAMREAGALAAARVGLALAGDGEDTRLATADWEALRADVDAVRASFASPQREVFDLLVAVGGLESGGVPDWTAAEQRCRALGWSRCDRAALEEMHKRSRP